MIRATNKWVYRLCGLTCLGWLTECNGQIWVSCLEILCMYMEHCVRTAAVDMRQYCEFGKSPIWIPSPPWVHWAALDKWQSFIFLYAIWGCHCLEVLQPANVCERCFWTCWSVIWMSTFYSCILKLCLYWKWVMQFSPFLIISMCLDFLSVKVLISESWWGSFPQTFQIWSAKRETNRGKA